MCFTSVLCAKAKLQYKVVFKVEYENIALECVFIAFGESVMILTICFHTVRDACI